MIRLTNLHGYERDTPFIEVHDQPSILIDLALSREIDSHALLRGSQLFLEDMLTARKKISPTQLLVMIANLRKHYRADDSSFLFGQRILPGYYGSVSQLLTHSLNLSEAINSLCQFHTILTPLLTPRYFESHSHFFIYWLDNCGAGDAQLFLVETYMTAVYAMTNWLSQEKLPWKFCFTFEEPRHIEQYWVHLNDQLQFNQQMNMMSISKDFVYKCWPSSAPVSQKMAENNALIQMNALGLEQSLLDNLYDYLKLNIQQNLYLEDVAEVFGMSAATFKRKLLKHDTHFQAQLDLARKHVALYLFQIKGYQHHQVAEYLRFNDMNNFRRAFKRWTGFSLAQLNEHCY